MNTLTNEDKAYIAFITGNNCHNYVWTLLSIFGAGKIYGGTGAPTHLSLEEQDAQLEVLCEKCHLNEHGLKLLADGTKVLK